MSGLTVSYKLVLGQQRDPLATVTVAAPDEPAATESPATSRIARMLALAHLVERLLDDGTLRDYRDAARRLGLSHPHLAHVAALVNLAPEIHEAILSGDIVVSERALRPVCRVQSWGEQHRRVLLALGTTNGSHVVPLSSARTDSVTWQPTPSLP